MVRGRTVTFGIAIGISLGIMGSFRLALAPPQSQGRALTIEDYYRIRSVGSPQISPDGKWVTYTVQTKVEEDNGTLTECYLVSADASAGPKRILHDGKDVTNPRFRDDGWLQYSSGGLWKIHPEAAASAPERAESLPRGVVPSPDGKWHAVITDQPQPKKAPVYASDFERRHQERFKGAIFDWKDFQRDGQPFPAPDQTSRPAAWISISPAGGGDARNYVDMDLRPQGLVWHPDGNLLLFTADSDWRNELTYGRTDLWLLSISDGRITRLTDDLYSYGDADFSPDGRYLSYVRSYGTDMVIREKLNHGGPRDLFIRPVLGGAPINLTAKWDLEPGNTQWSPDSRYIYFTAATGGENHLFRVSIAEASVVQVTQGPRRLGGLSIDKDFKTIVYTVGVHESPPDVYAAGIDGKSERRLTDVYRDIVSEIAFSKAECLHWPSYDGTQIEGWLMFPYGYDAAKGPYPMIVTSHGGPHSATGYSFDFKKQLFAANGYFVFDTNFRSSTGYGEAFKWATWGEWGKKDGEDVMSGIDMVLKRYPIDPKRVGHTGHSYGGFMTNWLITQYPDRFAAAITGAGISNWISDYGTADIYRTKETEFFGTPWDPEARDRMIRQSPLTYAGNVRTPTLFVHGEVDQRVPYEEGEQMYFALKRRGVPAKMIQYADQPHGIRGHWNNVHRMINELKWWKQYLK